MDSNVASGHNLHLAFPKLRNDVPNDPKAVLQEIFDLLEEFSPTWYSEEVHERAIAALKGN